MTGSFGDLFNTMLVIVYKGGWVVIVFALLYMFFKLYMDFINLRWYTSLTWVFLKVTVPRENEKSPLAFEHVFNQLHSTHSTRSFAEKYIEGQFQIWLVWELASIGGTIGNYVRVLDKHRDTVEAAIYSQFPDAEIEETTDYFLTLPLYHPEKSDLDIYAFSFILKKPSPYPIRTYLDFEHAVAETIVDPVTGLWEELGKLNQYEMFVMQFIFQPVDDAWTFGGYRLVKELKGEPKKESEEIVAKILGPILGPILDIFIRPKPAENARPIRKDEPPPSLMLHKTEGEKGIITAIERKLSRLCYATKIRCLYLAPKEKFNPSPVYTAVIGAIKTLTASNLNALKPDTNRWTKVRYWLFQAWEKPIVNLRLNTRKRNFLNRIRKRWFFHGPAPYYLDTEEIATLIHFPQTEVSVPPIEKVGVTKVQPPPELPVAG